MRRNPSDRPYFEQARVAPNALPAAYQEEALRPTTPAEVALGTPLRIQPPGEDDTEGFLSRAPGVLADAGMSILRSFNPFESGISGRQRLFRGMNVASLALPLGLGSRALATAVARVFPALNGAVQTTRGKVMLTAIAEAGVSGSIEALNDDEDRSITLAVMAGGVLGGGAGALAARASRNATARATAQMAEDFQSTFKYVSPEENPFATATDWAVLTGQDHGTGEALAAVRGTPAEAGVAQRGLDQHGLLGSMLSERGFHPVAVKMSDGRDGWLVPGMPARDAANTAMAVGAQQHVLTKQGLLDVKAGVLHPVRPGGEYVGTELDPALDSWVAVKVKDGTEDASTVYVSHRVDMSEPVRWGWGPDLQRYASAVGTQGINDLFDETVVSKSIWQRLAQLDTRQVLHRVYQQTIDGLHGAAILDDMLQPGKKARAAGGLKGAMELTAGQVRRVEESVAKLIQINNGKAYGITEEAFRTGIRDWHNVMEEFRPGSKGLFRILEDAIPTAEMDAFKEYAALARWDLLEQAGKPIPERAAAAMDAFRQNRVQHFDQALEELTQWQNDWLENTLVRTGVISRAQFEAITKNPMNSIFIPLVRGKKGKLPRNVEDLDGWHLDLDDSGIDAVRDPLKRAATSDVTDEDAWAPWLEELMTRSAMYARMASQQEVYNVLIDRISMHPTVMQRFLRAVDGPGGKSLGSALDTTVRRAAAQAGPPSPSISKTARSFMESREGTLADIDASLEQLSARAVPGDKAPEWAELAKLKSLRAVRALEAGEDGAAWVEEAKAALVEAQGAVSLRGTPGDDLATTLRHARESIAWAEWRVGAGDTVEEVIPDLSVHGASIKPPMARTRDGVYIRARLPESGEEKWFEFVDSADGVSLLESLEHLGPSKAGTVAGMLGKIAALQRAGTTLSQDFVGKNVARDIFFAMAGAGVSPMSFLRGATEMFFSSNLGSQFVSEARAAKAEHLIGSFMSSGAARSSLVSQDRAYFRQLVTEGTERGVTLKGVLNMGNPLRILQAFSEAAENATRIGSFQQRIKQLGTAASLGNTPGLTPAQIAQEAALFSKNASVDFSIHGSHWLAQSIGASTAFWNAAIQGSREITQALAADPMGVLGRGMAAITAPSILLYMHNRKDPDYQNLPAYERDLFWHIKRPEGMLGDDPNDPSDDRWLRVAKPFEVGIAMGSFVERFLEYVDTQDPTFLDEASSDLLGRLTEGYMPLPTAAQPWLETLANRTSLTQAPIVPQGMQEVDPEFHQGSTFGQALAGFLNAGEEDAAQKASPYVIDNYVRAWTGQLGVMASGAIDMAANAYRDAAGEAIPRPQTELIDRLPFVRAFVSPFPTGARSVSDAYALAEEARIVGRTLTSLEESARIDDLTDYVMSNRVRTMQSFAPHLEEMTSKIAELRQQRTQIVNTPGMTPQDKRRSMYAIDRGIITYTSEIMKAARQAGLNVNDPSVPTLTGLRRFVTGGTAAP